MAHPIDSLKGGPKRTNSVWGLAVHTTGSGIVEKARKHGANPFEYAVEYYSRPDTYWAHYVIDYSGLIVCISDEDIRTSHIGLDAEWRKLYQSGQWRKKLPTKLVSLWDLRWPGVNSPNNLYPGSSPNNVYIGVELLPLVQPSEYIPAFTGSKYTLMQHFSVRALWVDIVRRYNLKGIKGQLAGHEDVTPHSRHTRGKGWDPGSLRDDPWFSWSLVIPPRSVISEA